jgi:hypothetical protein
MLTLLPAPNPTLDLSPLKSLHTFDGGGGPLRHALQ